MELNEHLLVILSILLILFVFVSSASAADTNETDILSIDESANLESSLLSIDNNVESNELDNNTLRVSNDEVLTAGNNNWYVNGSMDSSGDGKSNKTAFKTLNEAICASSNNDVIMIASGQYTGENNTGLTFDKNLNFIKYGGGEAIFDAQGLSRIWSVSASSINITGLIFKNGKANNGGAIYFENDISNSNIHACFINNTATNSGGANYFQGNVSGSNVAGSYSNNNARSGGANCFEGNVSGSNVSGLYSNNKATRFSGGANCFWGNVSGSNVSGVYANNTAASSGGSNLFYMMVSSSNVGGTYSNNTAKQSGGANYFDNSVSDSIVSGVYTNNKAEYGGANCFYRAVSGSNVDGSYANNTATRSGGVNYFGDSVSDSIVSGVYSNNTATGSGGANHFDFRVSYSNVTGIYINNTASNATICFDDALNMGFDAYIINAIFLNNKCGYEICASTEGVVVKDSWFGNNASNFMNQPNNYNVQLDNWLFLNATADYTSLLVMDSSNITFKLYSTDGRYVDNSRLQVVNLTLTATNGDVDKTTTLDKVVKYMATEHGKGSVTAKIENASYTICFDNILRNVDLSVSAENITYLENEILTLSYNNTATGKINIILKSKNYNKIIKADINQTITISDLPAGEYDFAIKYLGDNVFSNATSYTNFTVEKRTTEVIPDKKTIDLFVDDDSKITYTLKPDYAVGNISFLSNDSNIVGVDSVSGDIIAKAEGSAIITVSFSGNENYTASNAAITVNVKKIPTQITVNSSFIDIKVNDETDIGAILEPANAGNLTYKSSDENIVKVENGKAKGLKEGNTTITVSFAGDDKYLQAENKTINVTVRLNGASVSVNNNTLDLLVDDTFNIVATTEPKDLTVNFTSNNLSVVTVDNGGNVVAVSEGNATITVSVGGDGVYAENSTTVAVTVNKVPTDISIKNDTFVLEVTDEVVAGATLTPADAGNVTYTVSNPSVVKINDGKIIALAEGEAIITVSFAGDKKYAAAENKTIAITVSEKPIHPKDNLTLEASAKPITVGENATVVVTGLKNATGDISVFANGKTYSAHIMGGEATVTVPGLTENVVAIVNYVGDDTYNPASTTVNITVSPKGKENATIVIDAPSQATEGDNVTVDVTLPEDATGTVAIGNEVVPIQNGTASAVLTNIPAGNTTIPITYSGDDKYNPIETEVTIDVDEKPVPAKENLTISATADPIAVGENATVVVVGFEYATGNVSAKVGNGVYTAPIVDGVAKFTISGLIENVTASITYAGDDRYNNASTSVDIVVNSKGKENATIVIDAPSQATEGDNVTVYVTLPEDATGTVTIGNEVVNVKNGTASVVLTNIPVGNITVPIIYSGDDKYNPIETEVTIDVDKKPVPTKENLTIIASADPITVGDDAVIVVTGFEDATGNVTVTINGKTYKVPINEGKATITVTELTENATATVSYPGDSKYNNASTSVDIVVYPKEKENATMNIDVAPVTEGQNTTVNVKLPEDAVGNVTAVIAGKTYTASVKDGKTTITILGLAAGNYTVPVTYSGDDKYNSITKEVNITVDEVKSDIINAPDVTKYFGGPERFVVTITDYPGNPLANKSVTISINGRSYDKTTDVNGTASIALGLNSGVYNATVIADNKTINSVVTILSTVNGVDIIKVFRNGTQYYATFRDGEGKYLKDGETVIFNINGVMYERKVSGDKGLAKLNINLNPGEYIITAMNTVTGDRTANNITVLSRITENADLVKYYRNASQYTVKVLGEDGKVVGAGETVRFNINGVFYERQTNASGVAKLNINLQPGDYIITAEYKNCRVSNNIKVLPVLNAKDITMKYRDGTQFKATLVDGQGKPYAGQTVTFNINGVFYNRATDSSGTAKLNINLMPGEYIITSSYNGASIANKITIKG